MSLPPRTIRLCNVGTVLGLTLGFALPFAAALPAWRTPLSRMPSLRNCTTGEENATEARLFSKLTLRPTEDSVVRWLRPNCAVGGTEVRIDAFLFESNFGEIGLGEASCPAGGVDLRHPLNDTWAVFWFLLYPGTYTICHRPLEGKGRWTEQVKFHLMEPTPQHCSQVTNASSVRGYVGCELPEGQVQMFFDGTVNEEVERPSRCAFDCEECLAEGGTCLCHLSDNDAANTCGACAECSAAQRASGRCQCVG
mmetsp:Transcript_41616/g.120511  ORF Transcript_41616/g.120511 Transcript_41616/m.120511 type:complete len:252 (+) Transcript_41616:66-821(+)